MTAQRGKDLVRSVIFLGGMLLGVGWTSSVLAANISEFVNITPYVEIGGGYDDNVYEIAEDEPLPEDAKEREDSYLDASAGVSANLTFERRLLRLGATFDYDFTYKKYSNNTELDDSEHMLNFDFNIGSQYEQGLFRDRVSLTLNNDLSFVPIDDEEALLPGNRTWRNDLTAGIGYNFLGKPRTAFVLGYQYGRVDFGEYDITVSTVADDYSESSDLTQESQTHTASANVKHALNSNLTYVLTYTYAMTLRDEDPGELNSANFARHNVLTGVDAKLTPRISTNIQAGYSLTTYEDIGELSQEDQDNFIAEASLTGNFNHRPLTTIGYRRHFTENDFGDTLLTDDLFVRLGFKLTQNWLLNVNGDYIIEDRALYDDDTTQIVFGAETQYELIKNMSLLAGYTYREKDFFEQNFLISGEREETSNIFSGGLEYKVTRYVLLRGMYYYTDKTSNIEDQEYNKNHFVASGRILF